MQDVLRRILERFGSASINERAILFADDKSRLCHLIACIWLADHAPKMTVLGFNLDSHSYYEVLADRLSEDGGKYRIGDH